MIKIFKLSRNLNNFLFGRYSSSYARRYQFKRDEPIYYPKRDLSKNDSKPALVQDRTHKSPSTSYYKILGIARYASSQEIKAAYYKLAKKFHPDATPTPQETKSFQQISEAYHVLSDEASRHEYDEYGTVRSNQVKLNILGDKMFNRERKKIKQSQTGQSETAHSNKNEKALSLKDVSGYASDKGEIAVKLKFLTAVLGGKEYIDLKAMVKCPKCHGSARITRQNNESSQKWEQTGQPNDKERYKVSEISNEERYVNKNMCKTCDNRGSVARSKRLELTVPPGTATGDVLKVKNPLTNQMLRIIVDVDKSKYFKRDGNKIFSVKYLTISQALLGGKFKIRGLYEDLELSLGPGIESHTTHCFKEKGIIPKIGKAGDHVVTFKIRIPKNLTTKQRQLILALSRTEDPTFDGL